MRNAITASQNANCVDFTGCNNLIAIFHTRKHKTGTTEDPEQATVADHATVFDLVTEHRDNEFNGATSKERAW